VTSWLSGLVFVALCAAIAALVAGCSDDTPPVGGTLSPDVSSTAGIVPHGAASPTFVVRPERRTGGWLVHVRDGDIVVSALDGSDEVTLSLPGNAPHRAGFGGVADIGGTRWLYFATQLSQRGTGTDFPIGEYALVRAPLGESAVEEVMRFEALAGSGRGQAWIAPDGSRVLHRGMDEIVVRDLVTGSSSVLFDGSCAEQPNTKCEMYGSPMFSPTGDAMIAKHHYYETSSAAFASPVTSTDARELREYGGELQAWSPDGGTFCTYSVAFVPAGVWLVDARTLAAEDLSRRFAEGTQIEGCWPGPGAMVAVMFRPAGDVGFAPSVAIFAPGSRERAHTFTLPDFWRIEGWLTHGSGLVVSKSNNCTPCNPDEPLVATVTFDGGMHALPFRVATTATSERDTSFVLAIVADQATAPE